MLHFCSALDAEPIWRSRSPFPSTQEHWNRGGGLFREVVIERVGAPKSSVKNADGTREDFFEYYEGSSSGWKKGRGIFHLVADLFTIALWEIVAIPKEAGLRGDKIPAQTDFDNTDRLTSFRVLGRETQPLE